MVEAYKVGITIALTNQISRGLYAIQGDLAKTDAQAIRLRNTLKEIKTLGIAGAILGGVGYAGLHALGKTVEAAKEYQQALAQFKAIGLGESVNRDADKFARGASVIGASATDLMQTVRDLHTAMGDYSMAKQLAPQIAQMKYANKAVFGEHGMDFGESQLRAMEKIVEMRGGFKSPQAFLAQADMMQKVISGTGGMVKPSDYMQFIQTAGVAGRLLNDEVFYYTMEPLIQEMRAGRVGTGTMSAYNNLAQGRSTQRAAREMQRIGLLGSTGVHYDKVGQIARIDAGALRGMDQFTSNPYAWLQGVLIPAMKAKGITSESAMMNEMGVIFGNRTGSNIFSLMMLQQEKIAKNMGISKNAMGRQELFKLAMTTPDGAEKAMGAAWKNLDIAVGQSLYPIIIPAMNKLADAIRWVGQMAYRHPRIFDWLIYGFAGLSSALLFSGTVLTLKAAFLGISTIMPGLAGIITASVVPALGVLGGALAALAGIAYHQQIANKIDGAAPGIGDWLYNMYHPGGRSDLDAYYNTPPAKGSSTQVTTNLHLDGRQIATAVTQHQSSSANGPTTSPSGFDGRMTPSYGGSDNW